MGKDAGRILTIQMVMVGKSAVISLIPRYLFLFQFEVCDVDVWRRSYTQGNTARESKDQLHEAI